MLSQVTVDFLFRIVVLKILTQKILTFTVWLGNFVTLVGCAGILFGVLGTFDMDLFSYGLSSGIRIIGSVAISGCLLSAIGYWSLDHFIK
jgi:hypothetical protein